MTSKRRHARLTSFTRIASGSLVVHYVLLGLPRISSCFHLICLLLKGGVVLAAPAASRPGLLVPLL
ncbi:hypothetical protein LZ32DRAFT_598523 [Colletotrichum eremochloae]|nr:hypothetical protein LZ32DRAFT_598523 [Colletotrichum eremochloae]